MYKRQVKHGGTPNFKGLYGFPGTACIDVYKRQGLRRVSKPGLRIYTNCEDMPKVMKLSLIHI